jgi:hypothetical protein
MKKLNYIIVAFIVSILFVFACEQQKLPLPVPNVAPTAFGASDTNYVELSPMWDATNIGYQFSNPQDITIGPDGIIFVADAGNDRVVALSKAGQVVSSNGLGTITSVANPYGVAIDSKLNVLIANGTNTLYCWNHYMNVAEIDSVSDRAVFFDTAKNDTVLMTLQHYIELAIAGKTLPQFRYFVFGQNPELKQQVTQTYEIYVDEQPDAEINGVAAGTYGSGQLYITESQYDRISLLMLVPQIAVKTNYRGILFRYRAIHIQDIATFGSGAGTVDNPWGMTTDSEGNLYFTQLGGNFRVQKLLAAVYTPGYVLYQHNIMDLNRFTSPVDIALDDLNNIFVIDSDLQTVSKFDNAGAGAGQKISLGKKGLAAEKFNNAKGIMVENNVVYVVDFGANRIRRFQYSVPDSDIRDDDKKP